MLDEEETSSHHYQMLFHYHSSLCCLPCLLHQFTSFPVLFISICLPELQLPSTSFWWSVVPPSSIFVSTKLWFHVASWKCSEFLLFNKFTKDSCHFFSLRVHKHVTGEDIKKNSSRSGSYNVVMCKAAMKCS